MAVSPTSCRSISLIRPFGGALSHIRHQSFTISLIKSFKFQVVLNKFTDCGHFAWSFGFLSDLYFIYIRWTHAPSAKSMNEAHASLTNWLVYRMLSALVAPSCERKIETFYCFFSSHWAAEWSCKMITATFRSSRCLLSRRLIIDFKGVASGLFVGCWILTKQ